MNVIKRITENDEVLIMGILNVTPDSFSDGGRYFDCEKAIERALEMEQNGADLIDIGGESTRPGAENVELDRELDRTIPVIEAIRDNTDIPISIDTYKSEVARSALDAGANIINDISALRFDRELSEVAAERNVPVILMHMQGTPQTMQENPTYDDPVKEIKSFLTERIKKAINQGISRKKIIVDPGIGFGKKFEHNFEILRRLDEFNELNHPLLLGTSRKSFIGDALNLPTDERVEGTIASNVVGVIRGADILRVHDVKENYRALRVAARCR